VEFRFDRTRRPLPTVGSEEQAPPRRKADAAQNRRTRIVEEQGSKSRTGIRREKAARGGDREGYRACARHGKLTYSVGIVRLNESMRCD